jgi:hypothetical protein
MNVEVIDFQEVKNSPCIGYGLVKYGEMLLHIMIMYRNKTGLFIEFPRARRKDGWVHCCWLGEKDKHAEFQLTVIRQLTEKYPDAKRIIDSKLKKVVQ